MLRPNIQRSEIRLLWWLKYASCPGSCICIGACNAAQSSPRRCNNLPDIWPTNFRIRKEKIMSLKTVVFVGGPELPPRPAELRLSLQPAPSRQRGIPPRRATLQLAVILPGCPRQVRRRDRLGPPGWFASTGTTPRTSRPLARIHRREGRWR